MKYEGNPKHKDPWQRGRKGSLCPRRDEPWAQDLLENSEASDGKRFACFDGKAYCAQEHRKGFWHGYPVGWKEVPPHIRDKWIEEGLVSRQDIKKHWDSSE